MTTPDLYCGFHIDWVGEGPGAHWRATHKDYDGYGDNRLFYGDTEEDVRSCVDDWWSENEADEIFGLALCDVAFGAQP